MFKSSQYLIGLSVTTAIIDPVTMGHPNKSNKFMTHCEK